MVGSLIFVSLDIEELSFAVKELARSLNTPCTADWKALVRVAKYMSDKVDWGVKLMNRGTPSEVSLCIEVDSDWSGGSCIKSDGKSTTGYRITVNEFVLDHSSCTQT
eukprot:4284121-Amphidinium_carterae.1